MRDDILGHFQNSYENTYIAYSLNLVNIMTVCNLVEFFVNCLQSISTTRKEKKR